MRDVEDGESFGARERVSTEMCEHVGGQVERAQLRQATTDVSRQSTDVVTTEVEVAQIGHRPELIRVQRTCTDRQQSIYDPQSRDCGQRWI